jgi:hypothetical protein
MVFYHSNDPVVAVAQVGITWSNLYALGGVYCRSGERHVGADTTPEGQGSCSINAKLPMLWEGCTELT